MCVVLSLIVDEDGVDAALNHRPECVAIVGLFELLERIVNESDAQLLGRVYAPPSRTSCPRRGVL